MMNKITKKNGMKMLEGKVKLVGSYWETEPKIVNTFICNNHYKVECILDTIEIRECVSQSSTQIKFKKSDGEYTYLTSLTNSKWYLNEIYNKKYLFIKTKDDCTLVYNIL